MKANVYSNMEPGVNFNKSIGKIGIELLTKAALCAATIGLIAGMAAALLSFTE